MKLSRPLINDKQLGKINEITSKITKKQKNRLGDFN